MSLRHGWVGGAIALAILGGAAAADVAMLPSGAPVGLSGFAQGIALDGGAGPAQGALKLDLASYSTGVAAPTPMRRDRAIIRYNTDWLAQQPAPSGGADWECLAQAVYFEARGESIRGQFAVAEVVLNRVDSGQFARSVCGVVKQRGGGACQFSYVCDGRADRMREPQARDIAERIAYVMLKGAPRALTAGATYFHTSNVRPKWSRRFERTAAIGEHLFYRHP